MSLSGEDPNLGDAATDVARADDFINPTAAAVSPINTAPTMGGTSFEADEASGHGGISGAMDALTLATSSAVFNGTAASPTVTAPSIDHINITSYIPFKLDLAAGNYSKWRRIMFFVLSKFGV
jgi:hypothetical protein